jgi:FkbM family methyltransferase
VAVATVSIVSLAQRAAQRLRRLYLKWRGSFAQEGEDLVLEQIFAGQPCGFYVDIGAHHPIRFSNTLRFYRRGWRGINIDAMPGSMAPFDRLRPRDINLEIAIFGEHKIMKYFQFDEPALNTFSTVISESHRSKSSYHITAVVELEGRPLADVLDEHLPAGVSIDFMTIDVEGFDLEVLQSNDWSRFRPRVLLVEVLDRASGENVLDEYLKVRGYAKFTQTARTVFYVLR